MARKETTTKKANVIKYYSDLGDQIVSLGFITSGSVFSYLARCKVNYIMDRFYLKREKVSEKISEIMLTFNGSHEAFVFVMDVPNSNNVEVICCHMMSKDHLIKVLKLRAFS